MRNPKRMRRCDHRYAIPSLRLEDLFVELFIRVQCSLWPRKWCSAW